MSCKGKNEDVITEALGPAGKVTFSPGDGGSQRLVRLAGEARALEMITSGKPVDAEQALALGQECYRLLEEGISTKEDIDKTLRLAFCHPMGQFELADFSGLDTELVA